MTKDLLSQADRAHDQIHTRHMDRHMPYIEERP
ncbi:hypothetical protein [Pseudomonas sp. 25 R 14]|nr:hypothetical protein [Pseudomonas sp. 25 R 14]